tara:strand:+ start:160 stop:972 length:813 start_codon:yes stop_codon:yes gene_type:complete
MLLIKKILFLTIASCIYTQDTYPFFNDMTQQLIFEKNRIYIENKSGEKMNVTGGESYTEMANPFGYILLNEDPDYVSKNKPIKTTYTYWSEFNIKQNGKNLSEIEFLKIIGLTNQANNILKSYTDELAKYNFKKKLSTQGSYKTKFKKVGLLDNNIGEWWRWFTWIGIIGICSVTAADMSQTDYGFGYADYSSEYEATLNFTAATAPLWLINTIKVKEPYEEFQYDYPNYRSLEKPIIKQSLSNLQIESLADSYNRKLYKQIKNGNFKKK